MKSTASMPKGEAPVKPNWRMFVAEWKQPTTNGTYLLKYGTIAVGIGVFVSVIVRPTWREYKYRRDEAFANMLFELDRKSKE